MGLTWRGRRGAAPPPLSRNDAYYVVAHFHYVLAVAAAFLIYGGVYLGLEMARRGRRQRWLGGLHLGVTFAGVMLIFLPQLVLGFGPASAVAPLDSFFLFNAVASAGYVLVLAAQVFFVAVLADALRPEADLR